MIQCSFYFRFVDEEGEPDNIDIINDDGSARLRLSSTPRKGEIIKFKIRTHEEKNFTKYELFSAEVCQLDHHINLDLVMVRVKFNDYQDHDRYKSAVKKWEKLNA